MILVSHPTGNQNVRSVLNGLLTHRALHTFVTTLGFSEDNNLETSLLAKIIPELKRRSYNVSVSKIQSYPTKEIIRLICNRLSIKARIKTISSGFTIDDIYTDLDRKTAYFFRSIQKKLEVPKALYAYEDGAQDSFSAAREFSIPCIYDLPIAYWEESQRLQAEEAARLPVWAGTLGDGRSLPEWKRRRKTSELEMADLVLCPSEFVKRSLPEWASRKRIRVIPFGSPQAPSRVELAEAEDQRRKRSKEGRPLRVLFCGSMGQRKGLGDLFQAMRLLDSKKVELIVLGSLQAPMEFYREEFPGFIHEVGRPHGEVLKLMRSCDLFCLPSIVEGRALVMQEAMSQALPLIITPNTGGEDLIREEETGFLVPIRSPERIAERIQWCLDYRDRLPEMGRSAALHAATYTWEDYGLGVVRAIKEVCGEANFESIKDIAP